MTDKERNALIPLPAGGLENIGSGPKSILSGMVSDALALVRVREKSLAAARFRIGDYEFRDPDYRQILIWAEALALEPEVFIRSFDDNFPKDASEDMESYIDQLVVEDGSIVRLEWDFHTSPIASFEWVDGLMIKRLGFRGLASTEISLRLPLLNCLVCVGIGLTEIDLSKVPALTVLNCAHNKLVELDLSKVPALIELQCEGNKLVELDLSNLPALTKFTCGDYEYVANEFLDIDLSKVPALTELECSNTNLVQLDLSKVPALTKLYCNGNKLVELDLSKVPALTELTCSYNQLVELDLSKVPALTLLECDDNLLVELDISMVPALTKLWCSNNQLAELDIRCLKTLTLVYCDPSVFLKKLPTQNF